MVSMWSGQVDDNFEKWWEEKHKDNRFCDLVDETLKEFFHEAWDAALDSQWVSVEESLPEDQQEVLYYFEITGITLGKYEAETNCFYSRLGFLRGGDVTYWMPSPKKPE